MNSSGQLHASSAKLATSPSNKASAVAVPRRAPDRARFFYSGAAALLLLFMFLGFQQFYLHGRAFPSRPLTPSIRALLIAHGIAMTAWMALLVVQTLLVANGKRRVHMTLGRIGAVLAASLFLLGLKVGIAAARVAPPGFMLWNMDHKRFLIVPVFSISMFAVFVTVGILNRRRPAIHRPMMLLATLAAIPAALNRIDAITSLYRQTVWGTTFGPFFASLVIGAAFLIVKWALTRKFDRYYALGWAALVVASAGVIRLATTPMWNNVATFLLQQ